MGAWVTVVRPEHPLCGQRLQVWGQLCRRGLLELVVVLGDGSKARLPAVWTDADADSMDSVPGASGVSVSSTGAQPVVAAVEDLIRLRALVSQLQARSQQRQEKAARKSPAKEDNRAANPAQSPARTRSRASSSDSRRRGAGQADACDDRTAGPARAARRGGGHGSGPDDRSRGRASLDTGPSGRE